jgi:hypothetical protein
MMNDHAPTGQPMPRRAQAVVELAVFGMILIFVIGSIFQQGYATILYQQSLLQPMRMALLKSYTATDSGASTNAPTTYKYNSTSIFLLQDQLSPGDIKNYGVSDRRPVIMQGGGTLSKGLLYPMDWADVCNHMNNAIAVMDVIVNGQRFQLSNGAAYEMTMTKADEKVSLVRRLREQGKPGDDCKGKEIAAEAVKIPAARAERMAREWGSFYTVLVNGNTGWGLPDADWQYDYNRNGAVPSDDLWVKFPAGRSLDAVWKWDTKSWIKTKGEISPDMPFVSADVNGDGVEDSIYSVDFGATPVTKNSLSEAGLDADFLWPRLRTAGYLDDAGVVQSRFYAVASAEALDLPDVPEDVKNRVFVLLGDVKPTTELKLLVLDSQAGDGAVADIDGYAEGEDSTGLKADASIYTKLSDGTVLELRHGRAYVPGTDNLASSRAMKKQYDVISREWQLNLDMAFPGRFMDRQNAAHPGTIEVQCGSAEDDPRSEAVRQTPSCCAEVSDNVLKTCFDLSHRRLFIRSRITDDRGRQWVNSLNTTGEKIFK